MAQTLKFGNKVWAAKEDSVLAYNDINNNYKPLPFSFSRASIGTRVNKDGLIETMGQDIARIDYTDSADGVLLLEPASTNLIAYSEDFSNVAWNKESGNQIINSNVEISPSNTLTADKLTVSSGSITTRKLWYQQTTTIGSEYTFSVYVKSVTGQVNTGFIAISYLDAITNQTPFTATDIWQRVVVTASVTNTSTRILITGDPNCQVYIWGAQFEALSYPTSYIATSGSTVTRAAETCNNSGNSEVFNDSEGVLFVDTVALANDGTARRISVSDGSSVSTTNNIYLSYRATANQLRANISGSYDKTITITDTLLYNKLLIKYKSGDISFWINGFEVDTSTSSISISGLNTLNFDGGLGFQDFYGKTKELGYYDTILTDAELETLTSYRNWVSMVNELNLNIIYNG